jgi:hypothetical protein
MSTYGRDRLQSRRRRPTRALAVMDYKTYCRLVWIRRQRGYKKHVRQEK